MAKKKTTVDLKNDKKIDLREANILFGLQTMGDIYVKNNGKPDIPHRHDYFTILAVNRAKGYHQVDYKRHKFKNRELHFICPGQVHQVVLKEKPKGMVITFSREFLAYNRISEDFINNMNLFRSFGDSQPIRFKRKNFDKIERQIESMFLCQSEMKYVNEALGAHLLLLLIYSNNYGAIDQNQLNQTDRGVCILRNFKTLVDENYKEKHSVSYYASAISITGKHLSSVVKQFTGKTAKQIIQERIILEAKRLLLYSEKEMKEIASELGFNEALHFSAFFKKMTNVSGTDFRKRFSKTY